MSSYEKMQMETFHMKNKKTVGKMFFAVLFMRFKMETYSKYTELGKVEPLNHHQSIIKFYWNDKIILRTKNVKPQR